MKLAERALEPRSRAPQHDEARLGDLDRALEVQHARAPRRAPRAAWARSRTRAAVPQRRISTLSSSVVPGGTDGCGRFGSWRRSASIALVDCLELGVERLDALAHLAHPRHARLRHPRRGAWPGRSPPRPGCARALRSSASCEEASALGVGRERSALTQLGAAAVARARARRPRAARGSVGGRARRSYAARGARACRRLRRPRRAATAADACSSRVEVRSMMRTPMVLRPWSVTSVGVDADHLALGGDDAGRRRPRATCSMPTTVPLRPSVLMSMMPLPARPCRRYSSSGVRLP